MVLSHVTRVQIPARAKNIMDVSTYILNHLCNPNVGVRGEITFVAMRDIKAGEELTTDYAMIDDDNLAGITAFFIDFLALQAYSRGLSLTIGGPIIIGGSMAVVVLIGFMLGEPITLMKILGIALIVVGGAVLAAISQ